MKIEFHIEGVASAAAFAAFLPQYQAALKADEETWRAARAAEGNVAVGIAPAASEPAPVAAEVEKPKRGRAAKATEPAPEPTPAIRATPEDRQPVEDAVVVAEEAPPKAYVREDLRAALAEYVEVVGMARANETKGVLLGYAKFSEVPEDAKAFEAAVVRIREAIEKEKAIND